MKNFVPLGTGNSRLMKSSIPAGTTWEQALAMLIAGTFPYDTGQMNAAGISQQGDPLNKNTLLKDATAQSYGGDETMVPDDVLAMLAGSLKVKQETTSVTLADVPLGYVFQLHENGQAVDFIKVSNNYSPGGVAFARKAAVQENLMWASSSGGAYAGNVLDDWLTNTYLPKIDENQQLIEANVETYSGRDNSTSIEVLKRKVFAPSLVEINGNTSYDDGSKLEYDLLSSAAGGFYWTRSPGGSGAYTQAWYVNQSNSVARQNKTSTCWVRPIVLIPAETVAYTETSYTLQTPTGTDVTGLVAQALGSIKVETGSYTGTNTYGSSNPNTLTFDFPVKVLIIRARTSNAADYGATIISGGEIPIESFSTNTRYIIVTSFGTTVSWYSDSAYMQLNIDNYSYDYVAIG